MSEARLIPTCGLPGTGKTTLARQLAADRGAVRLTKDEWLWALGSTPWDEPTREKVEHELWRLAQEVLRLGLSVVVDFGLWARIERDELRGMARGLGVGVELHYLDTPIDELWRRIEARNSESPWDSCAIRRGDFDGWLRLFEAPMRERTVSRLECEVIGHDGFGPLGRGASSCVDRHEWPPPALRAVPPRSAM